MNLFDFAMKKILNNKIDRAIENLKLIREEIQEFDAAIVQRIENIEDILMGESH